MMILVHKAATVGRARYIDMLATLARPTVAALCGVVLILCACNRHVPGTLPPMIVITGPTMGTQYTVKIVNLPEALDAERFSSGIQEKLTQLDELMSTYLPDSELSRFNRFDRNDWFEVSEDTALVIDQAVQMGEITGGAFDVTVGPLVNLWHFGPEVDSFNVIPSDEQIAEAKRKTGLHHIHVRHSPPRVLKTQPDITVDLSGIAKGFAVDRVAEHLEHNGIKNYLVEIGGDLRANGHNQHGRPWRIAIESPVADMRKIQRTVPLRNSAMATSGDYRNYFESGGQLYSHIIDPRTGRPVEHRLVSVTVFDPSCTRADALATALMVLGPEAGYRFAVGEKLPALFIITTNTGFVEKATPDLVY